MDQLNIELGLKLKYAKLKIKKLALRLIVCTQMNFGLIVSIFC